MVTSEEIGLRMFPAMIMNSIILVALLLSGLVPMTWVLALAPLWAVFANVSMAYVIARWVA